MRAKVIKIDKVFVKTAVLSNHEVLAAQASSVGKGYYQGLTLAWKTLRSNC